MMHPLSAGVASVRASLIAVAASGWLAPAVWAQGGAPLGPEFRVNTYTTAAQSSPAAAFDSSGNFVVVWDSYAQDFGVFGQRYLSSGTPIGAEFRVNTFTAYVQYESALAVSPSGSFLVTWSSTVQDGSGHGIFAQRFDGSGAPLGAEFRVNSYTTSHQDSSSAAYDASGNFIVVWHSLDQDGSSFGVFGQRYASTGAPLGPEFRVNTYTTNIQGNASVTADASGNFVVVWESGSLGSNVFGQRYAGSGAPLGAEFRVASYAGEDQVHPAIGADPTGNFVIVWNGGDFSYYLFGQRYASSGVPLGAPFPVNTVPASAVPASIAVDAAGDFVVVWASGDRSIVGVFGQRYAASGAPLGTEFRVNTSTENNQSFPSVGAGPLGNFVVVWMSDQDSTPFDVYGQRFAPIVPVELTRFDIE
jgi:hypothetical protein